MKIKNDGISLISLVLTIIVMLILAGITLIAILSDDGIIKNSESAKKQMEISNEQEIVKTSVVEVLAENGSIEQGNLQIALDGNAGDGATEVIDNEDTLIVKFIETQRYYEVDNNGDVSEYEVIIDSNPGDITVGINGETLDGSEDSPYEIWCIEDLVVFSNMVLGIGIKFENGVATEIETATTFRNKYIVLKQSLNFKFELSYNDSGRTDFGDVNGDGSEDTLINELLTGTGFNAIGKSSAIFYGNFDGENNAIKNLYSGALFGYTRNATIKNISVHGVEGLSNTSGIVAYVSWDSGGKTLIDNCHNYMNVEASGCAGGIVNYANNGSLKITNCSNHGNIVSNGRAGGIIGQIYVKSGNIEISNSYNVGTISGETSGGLLGWVTYDSTRNYVINKCIKFL